MPDAPHMTAVLSNREREVATTYAAGQSYKEIARVLNISPTTVRSHLRTVYRKLGVASKIELVNCLQDEDATSSPTERDDAALVAELGLELDEAVRRERVLARVLSIISRQGDKLDAVIDEVLEHALTLCEAEFGTLFEYDGDLQYHELRSRNVAAAFGAWLAAEGTLKVEPETGLGRVATTLSAVNITDVRGEAVYQGGSALRKATADLGNARSFAAIPMMSGDQLIGAFTVYRTRVHPFSDRALELARVFADQAAIAIQNARAKGFSRSPVSDAAPTHDAESYAAEVMPAEQPVLLAVLPFKATDTSDVALDRTGRKLAASVLMELSSSPLVRLVDHASCFSSTLADATPLEAARTLGADLVISGSLRRMAPGRYRVATWLHDSSTIRPTWSDRFDAADDDTHDLSESLVNRLCAAIDTGVECQMLNVARTRHTRDQSAMDHFIEGLVLHHRHDASDFVGARSHFESAFQKDPLFGRAAAALAITYVREWFWESERTELLDCAQAYARTAMGLTPHDAWTQAVWGVVALYTRRHRDAALSFARALELAPYDTYVVSRCGLGKLYGGEFEVAELLFLRALELNPLYGDRHHGFLGHTLYHLGRYDEAIDYLEGIAEPLSWETAWLAACYARQGRVVDANDTAARFRRSFARSGQDYQAKTRPFMRETDMQRLNEGLALAGITSDSGSV